MNDPKNLHRLASEAGPPAPGQVSESGILSRFESGACETVGATQSVEDRLREERDSYLHAWKRDLAKSRDLHRRAEATIQDLWVKLNLAQAHLPCLGPTKCSTPHDDSDMPAGPTSHHPDCPREIAFAIRNKTLVDADKMTGEIEDRVKSIEGCLHDME